ncbi:MAG: peptidylprolyl isomerase, partial [Gammaproteobacteria bacterium RBG_16_57_12]
DTSNGREPLSYIHGTGNIIPGLENALEGMVIGDTLKVTIAPENAYGLRNEELTHIVPRSRFENADDLEIGMQFQTMSEHGAQIVTITRIDENDVTVDANHPLAGMPLTFDVAVAEVRNASAEELDHGHVHGPGGHHH